MTYSTTLAPNPGGKSRFHKFGGRGAVAGVGCTDVLPPLTPQEIQHNRQSLTNFTRSFDVKGKLSGKTAIFKDGEPHDFVGMLITRLANVEILDERHCKVNGHIMNGYRLAEYLTGCTQVRAFHRLYECIDQYGTTNEDVRNQLQAVFSRYPV